MAKIAVELERALARHREAGTPAGRRRASSRAATAGAWLTWCARPARGSPYEERHCRYTIAIVLAGSFQYRSPLGHGLMTPGSLMLGNEGHASSAGISTARAIAACRSGTRPITSNGWRPMLARAEAMCAFRVPRLPPLRPLSPLIARAGAGAVGAVATSWEELAVTPRGTHRESLQQACRPSRDVLPLNAEARVSRAVRTIHRHPDAALSLGHLAREAGSARTISSAPSNV